MRSKHTFRSALFGATLLVVFSIGMTENGSAYIDNGYKPPAPWTINKLECSLSSNFQSGNDFDWGAYHWNDVYGMKDVWNVGTTSCPSDMRLQNGDGKNWAAWVALPNKGNLAVTYSKALKTVKFQDGNKKVVETDFMFNYDKHPNKQGKFCLGEGSEFGCYFGTNFRSVVIHELGHGIGLGHNNYLGLTTMLGGFFARPYYRPRFGYYQAWGHNFADPDDRKGGRAKYPTGNTSYEVATTPQFKNHSARTVANIQLSENTVCPGDTVKLKAVLVNWGSVSNTADIVTVLSKDEIVSGNYTQVNEIKDVSASAERIKQRDVKFTVPGSVNYDTRYYVGNIVHNAHKANPWWDTNDDTYMFDKLYISKKSWCEEE